MPNLGGILDPGRPASDVGASNDSQLRALQIPGIEYQLHRYLADGIAIALLENGVFENGPQPAGAGNDRYRLFLDGEIYNAQELSVKFDLASPAGTSPDAAICLRLFEHLGSQAFSLLNGLFVIALFDTETSELWLVTDRMGYRPLYYRQSGGRLVFGSEMKAIVAVDDERSVDDLGVLEMFSFGQPLMERTWLTGYVRLQPGTILRFRDGDLHRERYWTYGYDESAPALDQESYFTVYASLLDRAVARCMRGNKRIGIFLSGGYDSRAIAAAIREHHLPVPAYTFGESSSRDVRFAAQLAATLGLGHRVLDSSEPSLESICRPIVWRTEGMLPFIDNTSIRYHGELQRAVDIILVGLLAEFGGSHTWPGLLAARSRKQVQEAVFAWLTGSRQGLVRRYFRRDFVDGAMPGLREEFESGFDALDNDKPLNLADSWNFSNLQYRGSFHAPATDRHRFEIRAPHMDMELVDFLLTIPPMARVEQRVYKKMIAYAFPNIRDVPCTNSGKPINPNFALEYTLMTLRYLGRKIAGSTVSRLGFKPGLGRETSDLGRELDAEVGILKRLLVPMLDDGVYPEGIFDTAAIRTAASRDPPRDRQHIIFLSLLASWGLAARFLLYSQADEVPGGFDLPCQQTR